MQILTRKENGKRVPSEVAKEYQNTFEEVMIDEYQDSEPDPGGDPDQCVPDQQRGK